MAASWDTTKAAAMKILGKDGKIPEPKASYKKGLADEQKAYDAFDKLRKQLEDQLLALQDANSAGRNAVRQLGEIFDKSDLGLDPKDKEASKKIDQAKKILLDWIEEQQSALEANDKNYDELDKHLINISKYKGPAA